MGSPYDQPDDEGLTTEEIQAVVDEVARHGGTDAAVAPHGQNLRELEHLVDLGMRPADAIVAGTRTAAELLGLADELGTIQAGKLADLVVCAGDPLADITLLGKPENVVAVVQAGVVRKNTMLVGDVGSCDREADADSSGPSRR
jgi:predicted amidohydrolase YtcJ